MSNSVVKRSLDLLTGDTPPFADADECMRSRIFWDFTRKNFAEENLQFLLSVELFTTLPPNARPSAAVQIMLSFVVETAPLQVNINVKARRLLEETINLGRGSAALNAVVAKDCFEEARKQIHRLVWDMAVTFMASSAYKRMVTEAEEQSQQSSKNLFVSPRRLLKGVFGSSSSSSSSSKDAQVVVSSSRERATARRQLGAVDDNALLASNRSRMSDVMGEDAAEAAAGAAETADGLGALPTLASSRAPAGGSAVSTGANRPRRRSFNDHQLSGTLKRLSGQLDGDDLGAAASALLEKAVAAANQSKSTSPAKQESTVSVAAASLDIPDVVPRDRADSYAAAVQKVLALQRTHQANLETREQQAKLNTRHNQLSGYSPSSPLQNHDEIAISSPSASAVPAAIANNPFHTLQKSSSAQNVKEFYSAGKRPPTKSQLIAVSARGSASSAVDGSAECSDASDLDDELDDVAREFSEKRDSQRRRSLSPGKTASVPIVWPSEQFGAASGDGDGDSGAPPAAPAAGHGLAEAPLRLSHSSFGAPTMPRGLSHSASSSPVVPRRQPSKTSLATAAMVGTGAGTALRKHTAPAASLERVAPGGLLRGSSDRSGTSGLSGRRGTATGMADSSFATSGVSSSVLTDLIAAGDFVAVESRLRRSNAQTVEEVNARDHTGWTPLMWAANAGAVAICKLLLKRGADPTATSHNGSSCLHYLAKQPPASLRDRSAYIKLAVKLIANGAPLAPSKHQSCNTPLHAAAGAGNTAFLQAISQAVDPEDLQINATDGSKYTPMHFAARCGDPQVGEMLLRLGATLDPVGMELDGDGREVPVTPADVSRTLMHSRFTSWCQERLDDAVQLKSAIARGDGKRALAIASDHPSALGQPNPLDGQTPLHRLCQRGDLATIQSVLKKFPSSVINLSLADRAGFSAVHFACQAGNYKLLKMLLDAGAKATGATDSGDTVFHLLARAPPPSSKKQPPEWMQLFIDLGGPACLVATNKRSDTALHLAVSNQQDALVQFLVEKGGPKLLELKTVEGDTPLTVAQRIGCGKQILQRLTH